MKTPHVAHSAKSGAEPFLRSGNAPPSARGAVQPQVLDQISRVGVLRTAKLLKSRLGTGGSSNKLGLRRLNLKALKAEGGLKDPVGLQGRRGNLNRVGANDVKTDIVEPKIEVSDRGKARDLQERLGHGEL